LNLPYFEEVLVYSLNVKSKYILTIQILRNTSKTK